MDRFPTVLLWTLPAVLLPYCWSIASATSTAAQYIFPVCATANPISSLLMTTGSPLEVLPTNQRTAFTPVMVEEAV